MPLAGLWILLKKDLLRAWRNPVPYLLMLALPVSITAVVGLVFGPSSGGSGMPAIKIAYVDEDQTTLSQFLGGIWKQGPLGEMFEAQAMPLEEAMRRLEDNKLSAVIRVPKDFSTRFFAGDTTPPLVLTKNPAQSFFPAIVEEITRALTVVLDAISRNFSGELSELQDLLSEENVPDPVKIAAFAQRAGDKFQKAEPFLLPPLIGFETKAEKEEKDNNANVFAFLLPAISAMFLFFMADLAVRDIFRETEMKTLARVRTLRFGVLEVIVSKAIFGVALTLIASLILLGGGGLVFRITWAAPGPMLVLVLAMSICCSGFMAIFTAIMGTERRANTLNSILIMSMGFLGGSILSAQSLPAFLRDYVTPLLPNYWFIQSMNGLQLGTEGWPWAPTSLLLAGFGVVAVLAASVLFNRMLSKGVRP